MRLLACLFLAASLFVGCSRRKENVDPASPTPPPDLRADSERVQEAINRTAAKRAQSTPIASPSPTSPPP